MQYAVSNIAWTADDRRDVYARLQAEGITGLEIAPGLLFNTADDPFEPTDAQIASVRGELEEFGLKIVSMQSLLFGVEGADLLGEDTGRMAFERGLKRAITLAGRLEIPNLVMGSPKQRQRPPEMQPDAAVDRAIEILTPLADAAAAAGTIIAMECNPGEYDTNFLITPDETLDFVKRADHAAIMLNFDVGATLLTGTFDRVKDQLTAAGPTLSHVHISEPFLAPAPASPEDAALVLHTLHTLGYQRAVSIEMRRPEDGLTGLDAALSNLSAARHLSGGDP
ncbi:sugar phosphate isomerase/epimerase family protein [Ruegeria conchae]|uniref:Sugar phosphate isomerase/epimerase n=1 Tax=Ruegeria conchae TaxID=981384 RepID=A0A497ZF98_9RHOB|nr:sugar phosphate isomerase/epimerase family protein [Ruegeria conchae]RLK07370.1 sugar phosphate isomerase/epimerase [Ruegeria conchae]